MSEFGSTSSPSSSKCRKMDDQGLRPSVSIDSIDDVLSLESSWTSLSGAEPREDLSDAKLRESSLSNVESFEAILLMLGHQVPSQ